MCSKPKRSQYILFGDCYVIHCDTDSETCHHHVEALEKRASTVYHLGCNACKRDAADESFMRGSWQHMPHAVMEQYGCEEDLDEVASASKHDDDLAYQHQVQAALVDSKWVGFERSFCHVPEALSFALLVVL